MSWLQLIETLQLMKLPFTLIGEYKSTLTFDEIKKALENNETNKYFSGLQVDKYSYEISGYSFKIQRYSYGLDIFIASFPLITGEVKNQNPTFLSLKFKPNYFSILFFSFFVVMFISLGIFSDRDNLGFSPTDSEGLKRILHLVGGLVPGIWCYLRYIRPIKKTEQWIKEKLSLSQL